MKPPALIEIIVSGCNTSPSPVHQVPLITVT